MNHFQSALASQCGRSGCYFRIGVLFAVNEMCAHFLLDYSLLIAIGLTAILFLESEFIAHIHRIVQKGEPETLKQIH